jgi:hypothetical protein
MTGLLIFVGQSTSRLQASLNLQQEEINKGSTSQQVGTSLLKDLVQVAVNSNNPRLLELLRKSGITFTPNTNAPAPAVQSPRPPVPAAK